MIDDFDYKEPSCVLCGGKEFYNPKADDAKGRVPIKRIIEKIDGLFDKNDYEEAGRLLEYWQAEAKALNDKSGELALDSELIGYYRKTGAKDNCFKAIERAEQLITELGQTGISSATITLNMATGYKAFGESELALKYYDKTYEIYKNGLKEDDKLFAGLYNNRALAYVDVGKFDQAEKDYKKAIEILEKHGDAKPDQAISYVNLAHLYENEGDKKKAIECMYNAYNLLNDESIEQNGYYAYVLSKCAPSFGHFGFTLIEKEYNDLSEKIYERA